MENQRNHATNNESGAGLNSAASAGYPVVVTVSPGLDLHSIEHIQLIEKQLDAALLTCGYSRSETTKGGDKVVFNYWQCAIIG